ncbi:EF-hand domain-containing protein [Pseudoscourfieldia marina]
MMGGGGGDTALGEVRKVLHGVKIADCPPELREKLEQYDTNGNGVIDPNELPDALDTNAPFIKVSAFPKTLQPILREIDDEKNGRLEMDELTEVFTVYAEMKKANKEGSISIKTLPKEIQPTLKAFDVDGDGTVAPLELARAAELYKQSKKTAKRLMIFAGVLMVILCALVGVIVGLTAVVVEESKESKASGDGTLTKKGTSTPIAVGEAVKSSSIFDVVGMTPASLGGVKSLMLATGTTTRSFTVTGFTAKPGLVTFNTASGYAVMVSPKDYKIINIGADLVVATVTKTASARRRNLLAAHGNADTFTAGQTNEDEAKGASETCPTAAEPSKTIKCYNGGCAAAAAECPPVPGNVTETSIDVVCGENSQSKEACKLVADCTVALNPTAGTTGIPAWFCIPKKYSDPGMCKAEVGEVETKAPTSTTDRVCEVGGFSTPGTGIRARTTSGGLNPDSCNTCDLNACKRHCNNDSKCVGFERSLNNPKLCYFKSAMAKEYQPGTSRDWQAYYKGPLPGTTTTSTPAAQTPSGNAETPTPCVSGTTWSTTGVAPCAAVKVCDAATEVETTAPTATIDRVCAPHKWTQLGQSLNGTIVLSGMLPGSEIPVSIGSYMGQSISLSNSGTRFAVGAPYDNKKGAVMVFDWDGSSWTQVGNKIMGKFEDLGFGRSVALSGDGKRVAVGAPALEKRANWSLEDDERWCGSMRVYELSNGAWVQMGSAMPPLKTPIERFFSYTYNGRLVAINDNGSRVVTTATYIGETQGGLGVVRIYDYNGFDWLQVGECRSEKFQAEIPEKFRVPGSGSTYCTSIKDIEYTADMGYGRYGITSLAISANGNRIAVGIDRFKGKYPEEPYKHEDILHGAVHIIEWDGTKLGWKEIAKLNGEADMDHMGTSVSLSFDGKYIAGGAIYNDASGNNHGHVRVAEWDGKNYRPVGADIDPPAGTFAFGNSVSLSFDGNAIAIGALEQDLNGSVRLYKFKGSGPNDPTNPPRWTQYGDTIKGVATSSPYGAIASLSSDGTKVAIGAKGFKDSIGQARVFAYTGPAPVPYWEGNCARSCFSPPLNYLNENHKCAELPKLFFGEGGCALGCSESVKKELLNLFSSGAGCIAN